MDDVDRTKFLGNEAVRLSEFYKGKVRILPKVPIRSMNDFSFWYTPGVAEVSRRIMKNLDSSFQLTGRWNSVAIITDGSRTLGLGNTGPEAALAVMEGKSLLFNYLGGVNAVPIPIRINSREEFISVAKALEPAFGGYNLEDIESPKCFYILKELQDSMNIPVWHDDQLGTASAELAGLLNALKITGRERAHTRIVFFGSGAANVAAAYLLEAAGFKMENIIMVDSRGILEPEREDMDKLMLNNPWKYELAMKTNGERRKGGPENAFRGADVIISASKSDPNTLKPEWIKSMNSDSVIFALANPDPEIWPEKAKEAGAKVVATGRSDFPNQLNNSLVFPAIFRGVLDSRSKGVNFNIMVKASEAIADFIEDPAPDRIVPTMGDEDMFPRVAAEVAYQSVQEGLARVSNSREGFYREAKEIIDETRKSYSALVEKGYVKKVPGE